VADFVGRINALPALARTAACAWASSCCAANMRRCTATPRARVRVYLRPEDVLARPIAPGDDNVFEA
jgi:iron(III) transport system ATP-binding protein